MDRWVNVESSASPVITVALPLYRAKSIAWLAMESLCSQKVPPVPWELVVFEEAQPLAFGKANVFNYSKRLEKVGCCRIVYLPTDKWVPLSIKWRTMAVEAAPTSKYFILQAADCYSPKMRLCNTYHLFTKRSAHWVQSYNHVLYNLNTGKCIHYCQPEVKTAPGGDMAVLTELVAALPQNVLYKHIDSWFLNCVRAAVGGKFILSADTSRAWLSGANVTGLNNISNRNSMFSRSKCLVRNRVAFDKNIEDHLPEAIVKRLVKARGATKDWVRSRRRVGDD